MKKWYQIVTIALLAAGIAHASIVDDFSSASAFANSYGASWTNAAGIGGTAGYVDLNDMYNGYNVYQGSSYDATTFSGAKVGAYFFMDDYTAVSSRPLSFGFTSASTDGYTGSTSTTGIDIKAAFTGTGGQGGLAIFNDGATVVQSSQNITVANDQWYYLELTIGGVSNGNFTAVTAELFESDSNGTLGTSLKFLDGSGAGGYTVASTLTTDTSVYGFYGGIGPGSRGMAGLDNFTVAIPEPATMGMVAFFGAALLFIRRRFLR